MWMFYDFPRAISLNLSSWLVKSLVKCGERETMFRLLWAKSLGREVFLCCAFFCKSQLLSLSLTLIRPALFSVRKAETTKGSKIESDCYQNSPYQGRQWSDEWPHPLSWLPRTSPPFLSSYRVARFREKKKERKMECLVKFELQINKE